MNQLRYHFLLSLIRDLEDQADIAGHLASELSKAGEVHHSLASSQLFMRLDARLEACQRLSRVLALKLPELLETTYD